MQTPLDFNFSVASETSKEPPFDLFDGVAPLGWDFMVAPVSETAHPGDTSDFSAPEVGTFPKLRGGDDAPYQMAPSLSSVIGEALQGKQVSVENIQLYLKKQKNLSRYDRAFRRLWAFCVQGGGTPRICPGRKLPAGY